jgi:hypothetical protein
MAVRVTVADTWQTVHLDAAADQTVASLKTRALTAEGIPAARAATYEVKFGGAPVRDESRTLGALGAKTGSPFIVLSKRRRAVR